MTPNDLIADLRDIHTPEVVHETAMLLSPYPLIAFAVLLAAGLWWSHRRATNWRREGAKRLVEVTRITDPVKRLAELIALFQKVARRSEAGSGARLPLPTHESAWVGCRPKPRG